MRTSILRGAVVAVSLTCATDSSAFASLIYGGISTCQDLNCEGSMIAGLVHWAHGNSLAPWTAQIQALAGECLRLDVLDESAVMGMTVIAPRGDETFAALGHGADPRPLLRINGTEQGFYTVQMTLEGGG